MERDDAHIAENACAHQRKRCAYCALIIRYDFSQVAFPDGYGVDDLKSLSFVEAAQDFVFHGQTGRGKTHLAIAVGHACAMAGKAVRFYTAAELALRFRRPGASSPSRR